MDACLSSPRRRMAHLLVTDSMKSCVEKLNVSAGEFNAEVVSAYASEKEISKLDASEVFAVFELCVKTGLYALIQSGDAHIRASNGRAVVEIGFSGLHMLARRQEKTEE